MWTSFNLCFVLLHSTAVSCAAAYIFHSCTCSWTVHISFFRSPFPEVSLIILFLCDLLVPTIEAVWQYCHHFFWACIQNGLSLSSSSTTSRSAVFLHNSLFNFCMLQVCKFHEKLNPANFTGCKDICMLH